MNINKAVTHHMGLPEEMSNTILDDILKSTKRGDSYTIDRLVGLRGLMNEMRGTSTGNLVHFSKSFKDARTRNLSFKNFSNKDLNVQYSDIKEQIETGVEIGQFDQKEIDVLRYVSSQKAFQKYESSKKMSDADYLTINNGNENGHITQYQIHRMN